MFSVLENGTLRNHSWEHFLEWINRRTLKCLFFMYQKQQAFSNLTWLKESSLLSSSKMKMSLISAAKQVLIFFMKPFMGDRDCRRRSNWFLLICKIGLLGTRRKSTQQTRWCCVKMKMKIKIFESAFHGVWRKRYILQIELITSKMEQTIF